MAKKSSSMKSFRNLFSRSEANLVDTVERDDERNKGEKKKFKFFTLKAKSKKASASDQPANKAVRYVTLLPVFHIHACTRHINV